MEQTHQGHSPCDGSIATGLLAYQGTPEGGWDVSAVGKGRTIVLTRPLDESEWGMIRAFIEKTDRDDLRLRFGQSLDFADTATLKRFFDIGGSGEMVCMLDEAGDISGILHRVLTSPFAAEIALIVRSDVKRTGIGGQLLRTALSRAAGQNLKTLHALVLRENGAMLRLARKLGLMPRRSCGSSVELQFDLGSQASARSRDLVGAAAAAGA